MNLSFTRVIKDHNVFKGIKELVRLTKPRSTDATLLEVP